MSPFRLLSRDLEPFASSDPFHPLGIDRPALATERSGDTAIAVPVIRLRKADDVSCKTCLVLTRKTRPSLSGTVLTENLSVSERTVLLAR